MKAMRQKYHSAKLTLLAWVLRHFFRENAIGYNLEVQGQDYRMTNKNGGAAYLFDSEIGGRGTVCRFTMMTANDGEIAHVSHEIGK